jgi:hypothetical protein
VVLTEALTLDHRVSRADAPSEPATARADKRHPSPATAISLLALVIAMSGIAYAAAGGTFILGKARDQVPQVNVSELDGRPASAFLPVHGTAANSAELGGKPAGDYVTGSGQVAHAVASMPFNNVVKLNLPNPLPSDYYLQLTCTH